MTYPARYPQFDELDTLCQSEHDRRELRDRDVGKAKYYQLHPTDRVDTSIAFVFDIFDGVEEFHFHAEACVAWNPTLRDDETFEERIERAVAGIHSERRMPDEFETSNLGDLSESAVDAVWRDTSMTADDIYIIYDGIKRGFDGIEALRIS